MGEVVVRSEALEALQATAAALIAQVNALLPEGVNSTTTPVRVNDVCLHENREKAPRMGAEHAWYCPDCHEQGDK